MFRTINQFSWQFEWNTSRSWPSCSAHSRSLKLIRKEVKVKVKQSLYRSGQAVRILGGGGPQISRWSAHKCGKVVRLRHWPPLRPGDTAGTYSCWRSSRSQDHSTAGRMISMKIYGIELATFRLLKQCLNPLRNCVPPQLNRRYSLIPKWRLQYYHLT